MDAFRPGHKNSQSTGCRRNTRTNEDAEQKYRGRDGSTGNVPHVCEKATTRRQGGRTKYPSKEAHYEKGLHIRGHRLADESEQIQEESYNGDRSPPEQFGSYSKLRLPGTRKMERENVPGPQAGPKT